LPWLVGAGARSLSRKPSFAFLEAVLAGGAGRTFAGEPDLAEQTTFSGFARSDEGHDRRPPRDRPPGRRCHAADGVDEHVLLPVAMPAWQWSAEPAIARGAVLLEPTEAARVRPVGGVT